MLLLTTGAAAVAIAGVAHCSLYSRTHQAHTRARAHTCMGTHVPHANASGEDAKKEKKKEKKERNRRIKEDGAHAARAAVCQPPTLE